MLKTVIISIALIGLAFVLLGIKVLFIKGSRFPSGHVHASPQLRQRGVRCEAHAANDDNSKEN